MKLNELSNASGLTIFLFTFKLLTVSPENTIPGNQIKARSAKPILYKERLEAMQKKVQNNSCFQCDEASKIWVA